MRSFLWVTAFSLASALSAPAQEKASPPGTVYKVDFNIRDGSDAAAKAGRHYTILVEAGSKGTFSAGDKVPYATGSFQPGVGGVGVNPLVNTQYTYLDTGVNIDCRVREVQGRILLNADINISTVVQHDKTAPNILPNPTVASLRISGISAVVDPGKPAMVASIDDPVTKRKFEVTATVTKVS